LRKGKPSPGMTSSGIPSLAAPSVRVGVELLFGVSGVPVLLRRNDPGPDRISAERRSNSSGSSVTGSCALREEGVVRERENGLSMGGMTKREEQKKCVKERGERLTKKTHSHLRCR